MGYVLLALCIFVAGMVTEFFIARNNPKLITDFDAFVKKADTEVIAKLKARLLK